MSLLPVITTFATGTYAVTRSNAGSMVNGRLTAGSQSNFNIQASVRPVTGDDLKMLDIAEMTTEVRVLYTTTLLHTRTATQDSDVVTIDGAPWSVFRVLSYNFNGFYKVFVINLSIP